jgi:hypothetical protein
MVPSALLMRSATKALSYRSAGRSFPIRCKYSFHSGGHTAATIDPHYHTYIEASCAIFRISTGVVGPQTVAITNARS